MWCRFSLFRKLLGHWLDWILIVCDLPLKITLPLCNLILILISYCCRNSCVIKFPNKKTSAEWISANLIFYRWKFCMFFFCICLYVFHSTQLFWLSASFDFIYSHFSVFGCLVSSSLTMFLLQCLKVTRNKRLLYLAILSSWLFFSAVFSLIDFNFHAHKRDEIWSPRKLSWSAELSEKLLRSVKDPSCQVTISRNWASLAQQFLLLIARPPISCLHNQWR